MIADERLLTDIASAARLLMGAAACSIALLNDDETELVYTAAAAGGAGDVHGARLPVDRGIAGWVASSGEAIYVSDVNESSIFARDVAEETGYVPTSVLAVPVRTPRRMLGVLTLLDRDTTRPNAADDLKVLAVLADQAAVAIESAALFAELSAGGAEKAGALDISAEGEKPELAGVSAMAVGLVADFRELAEDDRAHVLTILTELSRFSRRRRRSLS